MNLYLDLINTIYDILSANADLEDVRLSTNLPAPDESIIIQTPLETGSLETIDRYSIKRFDIQIKCHSTQAKRSIELSQIVIDELTNTISLSGSGKTAKLFSPQRDIQQYDINGQDYRDVNIDYSNILFAE